MKIRRDPLDTLFSNVIRARDRQCVKCGKMGRVECSHIIGRRSKGLRWDVRNAKALCFSCHRWWHENPVEAVEWLKAIIGETEYDTLRYLGSRPTKFTKADKAQIKSDLQALLKRYEGSEYRGIHPDSPFFAAQIRKRG